MRAVVVTAADESFFPLLRGLIGSLEQFESRPALACLDVGLSPASREWVALHAQHVVVPEWDLPVDPRVRDRRPHIRALTARPFLPRYFPGYDIYLWIDADAWVQERFALDWYLQYARGGALVAVPEVDRAYRHTRSNVEWRMTRVHNYFGPKFAQRALWKTYFNAGVFALRADAPHWEAWERSFREGLEVAKGVQCCDQTALNHALWTMNLAVHPLPALCNWLCHYRHPVFDAEHNRLCEPVAPSRPIGVLHLAAQTKDLSLQLKGDGGTRVISLRFPAVEPPGPGGNGDDGTASQGA